MIVNITWNIFIEYTAMPSRIGYGLSVTAFKRGAIGAAVTIPATTRMLDIAQCDYVNKFMTSACHKKADGENNYG